MNESDSGPAAPRVSVVFLLYNAASEVPALVEALRSQSHPGHASQAGWLEAIFMDDTCTRACSAKRFHYVWQRTDAGGAPAHGWLSIPSPERRSP